MIISADAPQFNYKGAEKMSIIKRRKTSEYLQLHNYPVQKDLEDLAAIGLLTYIMSLPEDWTLRKTQLQAQFSRRKTDGAWKLLAKKKYAVGFICYVDRKKTYYYNVSDQAFSELEYLDFVEDTLREILTTTTNVSSIKEMPDNAYIIPNLTDEPTEQNVQYTTVQKEQYKEYSTIKTVQSVHLQIKDSKKKYQQRNNNKGNNIDNYQDIITDQEEFKKLLTDSCHTFYSKFSAGRYSKEHWNTIVNKFVDETVANNRHLNIPREKITGYAYSALKKITDHTDYKRSDEFQDYQEAMRAIVEIRQEDLPF